MGLFVLLKDDMILMIWWKGKIEKLFAFTVHEQVLKWLYYN